MKERKSLVAGMTDVDRSTEEQFVYSDRSKKLDSGSSADPAPSKLPKSEAINPSNRVPVSTRIRADYATALKRASLERQLDGETPNTLQDILEEALEPWLQANGYLTSAQR